jgi:hypothetical protein
MALRPAARLAIVAFGAIAIAVGIPGFFRFKRFVDENPRLCITCHRASPEFQLWLGGSHRKVACQRCHHTTAKQTVAMLRSFVEGRNPDEKHASVEVGACAGCHFSHDPNWPQVGGSRGHRIHYEEQKIACVRCHAASMHGFTPMAERCAECHPNHAVSVGGMEQLHCFACHEFLTDEPGLRPTRHDCMRCHTAQGIHAPVNEHGELMGLACSECHKPHAPPEKALVACTECHPKIAAAGLHRRHGKERCVGCHVPHTWEIAAKGCARCHAALPADHPEGQGCAGCHDFHPPPSGRAAPLRGSIPPR